MVAVTLTFNTGGKTMRRKRQITDIYLTQNDLERLKKGKRILKQANNQIFCLVPSNKDALQHRIVMLEQQIAMLKGKDNGKRAYTKRNSEYWSAIPSIVRDRFHKKGE